MYRECNCPNCNRDTTMPPYQMAMKYGFIGKMCQYCAKELFDYIQEKKNGS